MPKIYMRSSYFTNYYPHFIDFKMPRQIWATMAEMAKTCKNGHSALIRPKAKVIKAKVINFRTPKTQNWPPKATMGTRNAKKGSSPILITDDKKSILERVNFFCVFFYLIWPPSDMSTICSKETSKQTPPLVMNVMWSILFFIVQMLFLSLSLMCSLKYNINCRFL